VIVAEFTEIPVLIVPFLDLSEPMKYLFRVITVAEFDGLNIA
jgi:hypothetical protein